MPYLGGPHGYSRMEEDHDEIQHRRAQFLIYKSFQKADSMRKPSGLKVKVCRLKIKIGRKLKRLRKSISLSISVAKGGFYKPVIDQIKILKRLLRGRDDHQPANDSLPVILF
ncbi:hypothetical protein LIER_37875 [Lithospermum erythrorhizon]|uniref:Uncharacterized protein n=1 Tax=Lithospermum erythrorhizon TaxID=34254 RepID=A0AAV3PRS2_LITER